MFLVEVQVNRIEERNVREESSGQRVTGYRDGVDQVKGIEMQVKGKIIGIEKVEKIKIDLGFRFI